MKKLEFQRMKEVDDDDMLNMSKLKIGDKFLYGKNIIAQKSLKEVGQPITFYEVIEKEGSKVIYMPIYETLEEDSKNG